MPRPLSRLTLRRATALRGGSGPLRGLAGLSTTTPVTITMLEV